MTVDVLDKNKITLKNHQQEIINELYTQIKSGKKRILAYTGNETSRHEIAVKLLADAVSKQRKALYFTRMAYQACSMRDWLESQKAKADKDEANERDYCVEKGITVSPTWDWRNIKASKWNIGLKHKGGGEITSFYHDFSDDRPLDYSDLPKDIRLVVSADIYNIDPDAYIFHSQELEMVQALYPDTIHIALTTLPYSSVIPVQPLGQGHFEVIIQSQLKFRQLLKQYYLQNKSIMLAQGAYTECFGEPPLMICYKNAIFDGVATDKNKRIYQKYLENISPKLSQVWVDYFIQCEFGMPERLFPV